MRHYSVLLNETIQNLNIKPDGVYVDCTLGNAGHSSEILKQIPNGFLYSFDLDLDAIAHGQKHLSQFGNNFEIIHSNFANLKEELNSRGVEKIDGIIYDLGVSSMQFDQDHRGFSYRFDADLDMRMNQNQKKSAKDIINSYSPKALNDMFKYYGDEKYAYSIAKNIDVARKTNPINTTLELVEIIKKSVPMKYSKQKHPAKKVFQALRIETNDEINSIETSLTDAVTMLKKDANICVITFHSLEDKITLKSFKKFYDIDDELKKYLPQNVVETLRLLTKKPILPSQEELEENNRSHSAKLRVAKKMKDK